MIGYRSFHWSFRRGGSRSLRFGERPEALRQALRSPNGRAGQSRPWKRQLDHRPGVRGMFRQIEEPCGHLGNARSRDVGDPVRGYALAFIGIGVAFIATIPLIFYDASHPQASKQYILP